MRTYQKQHGGQIEASTPSPPSLVYYWVKENWYRELSQICHSARAYVLMLLLMRSESETRLKQRRQRRQQEQQTSSGFILPQHQRFFVHFLAIIARLLQETS